ncbi:MAG: outer membrane beta-barrel protein [Ferruginibacter sp.]
MDELFQRAAENYPLQPGKGEWESIAKRIAPAEADDVVLLKKKTYRKSTMLLLILALPVGWLLFRNISPHSVGSYNYSAKPIKENSFQQPGENNGIGIKLKKDQPGNNTGAQINRYHKKILQEGRIVSIKLSTGTGVEYAEEGQSLVNKRLNDTKSNQEKKSILTPVFLDRINRGFPGPPGVKTEPGGSLNITVATENKNLKKIQGQTNSTRPGKQKKNVTASIKNKSIYIGLVAGPDLSKVQSMGFSTAGIATGLIAGVGIGKSLFLETGVIWTKKYYDSKGSDFSMDKIGSGMAPGMIINDLSSQSTFIEIPVKIRYDALRKRNGVFFIAAGVSAYIMTKEKNLYNVTMNGSQEKMTGLYKQYNYGIPAIANIGIGYQQNVSRLLQLRVEPVLKIPLKGIGVGSLPVTSTGLQFALIRRFK